MCPKSFVMLSAILLAGVARAQPAATPTDAVPDKMPFDVPYGAPIGLDRAEAAIHAALAEARKHDWKMNVAVVDSGGNLVAFERMDRAQLASAQIAQHKARAAATYRRETKVFEEELSKHGPGVLALDGVIAARGGIPLVEAGRIIGAIGCSGGAGTQDELVCKAGVASVK